MRLLFMLLQLACIIITCVVSGFLYLKNDYNMSGLLVLVWVVSLMIWVKSYGLLEDKKEPETSKATEAQ